MLASLWSNRMFYRRPDYQPTAYDDDWEDIPASGSIAKWLGGVVAPIALITYGVTCFSTRHGMLPGRNGPLDLFGADAIADGLAIVSLGLFLHCHYFWGNIFHLATWAVLGKIVSLIGLIGGLVYLMIHVGVLGR